MENMRNRHTRHNPLQSQSQSQAHNNSSESRTKKHTCVVLILGAIAIFAILPTCLCLYINRCQYQCFNISGFFSTTPHPAPSKKDNGTDPRMNNGTDPPMNIVSDIDELYISEEFLNEYEQMERVFKIYMYPDEGLEMYYQLPRKLTGKHSNEGFFFKNLNESRFLTTVPREAHLKFIPISTYRMQGKRRSYEKMAIVVQKYVQSLVSKYHYCDPNEDHFFVNCHDIGVIAANGVPLLENASQVVCGSWFASEFRPSKDVILPAQKLQPFSPHPNRNSRIHRSEDEAEFDKKLCPCQINPFYTACIAESISDGCIPVVSLSELDLPFKDTLDWTKFSVTVTGNENLLQYTVKDIDNQTFTKLHKNLLKVQKHFTWNTPPVRFDAFHMVMYELWKRI
ncbi:probable glycosyltransferase At5g03795 isoform X1 [Quercus suber]|uniref:Glycosyltransferase n=1 Tax=Quercus suber TaxID=58331 RepID=A0AAW0LY65_QUESU